MSKTLREMDEENESGGIRPSTRIRQNEFLAAYARLGSRRVACNLLGLSPNSITYWRTHYPEFEERYRAVVNQLLDGIADTAYTLALAGDQKMIALILRSSHPDFKPKQEGPSKSEGSNEEPRVSGLPLNVIQDLINEPRPIVEIKSTDHPDQVLSRGRHRPAREILRMMSNLSERFSCLRLLSAQGMIVVMEVGSGHVHLVSAYTGLTQDVPAGYEHKTSIDLFDWRQMCRIALVLQRTGLSDRSDEIANEIARFHSDIDLAYEIWELWSS